MTEIDHQSRFDAVDLTTLSKRSSEKWSRYPPEVLPAFIAEMDLPVAEPVLHAVRSALEGGGDLGYAYTYAVNSPLQQAFSLWLRSRFDWPVATEAIVPFPDTMRVIEVALEHFAAPGEAVVIDTPAYPPFFDAIPAAGRTLVANPMQLRGTGWQINLPGLEQLFAQGVAVYLLCNPHNPTGRVFTRPELAAVLRLAARYGVTIVSDEVHAPLVYRNRRHLPIGSLPEAAAVATVTAMSASKGWNVSGLKCAVAVVDHPQARERLMAMRPRDRDGVGILGVQATIAALRHGGPWLESTVHYLEGNQAVLADLLGGLGPDLRCHPAEGTYLAWLDCRRFADRIGTADLAQYFLDVGKVAISDGRQYGREGFVRVNVATSRQILEEMARRIEKALREAGAELDGTELDRAGSPAGRSEALGAGPRVPDRGSLPWW
jgi:cystathionine beta-lyase